MVADQQFRRTIQKGDVVRFLPEFCDPGDEAIVFIAIDSEEKGRVTVEAQVDMRIKPTQVVESKVIDRSRSGPVSHAN